MRHPQLLSVEKTCLLVIDVQERLLPVIHNGDLVVKNIRRLVAGAEVLGLPVILSEQYPKGLGPTVEPVAELMAGVQKCDKTAFSCIADQALAEAIARTERDQLLLCGVESHVCVLQTALDSLAAGYSVHVAADAVSSRDPENKKIAIERLRAAGCVITCTESALFELLVKSGTGEFKKISALVK
ncbi:MAG: hydrolase [Gemmatimonadota bacterium]|nr:hydrolase [Gemmatimonadota bacterium]